MNNHIIITAEQAENIRGKYGKYSAIEPVPLPDGNYIIPEKCLHDVDLADAKEKIEQANGKVQDIIDLPEVGQPIEKDRIYKYSVGEENGYSSLVIAVQEHIRTIYKPEETPALFSFFRENSDDLEFIPNELVRVGWRRWYNGKQYEVIQGHQTQDTWNPEETLGVLWRAIAIEEPEVKPPQWVSGDYYKYKVGTQVYNKGQIWEAINLTHTWIEPALAGNGAISWKFVRDWIE